MTALYLPSRRDYIVEYNLPVGNYTWTAPAANAPGTPQNYKVDIWMWAGGASGATGNIRTNIDECLGGGGGGGGGFVRAQINVSPTNSFNISVGAGGLGIAPLGISNDVQAATNGNAGGNTSISNSSDILIIQAIGGSAPTAGSYASIGAFPVGGLGGSFSLGPASSVLASYYGITGGNGSNGGILTAGGSSVLPFDDQPGAPILINPISQEWRKGAGSGGPSAHEYGGIAGGTWHHLNNAPETPGSGGGAGYFPGENGLDPLSPETTDEVRGHRGSGKGGDGYFRLSFTVQASGSAGSAPTPKP